MTYATALPPQPETRIGESSAYASKQRQDWERSSFEHLFDSKKASDSSGATPPTSDAKLTSESPVDDPATESSANAASPVSTQSHEMGRITQGEPSGSMLQRPSSAVEYRTALPAPYMGPLVNTLGDDPGTSQSLNDLGAPSRQWLLSKNSTGPSVTVCVSEQEARVIMRMPTGYSARVGEIVTVLREELSWLGIALSGLTINGVDAVSTASRRSDHGG